VVFDASPCVSKPRGAAAQPAARTHAS
jgi:hypothetical protein